MAKKEKNIIVLIVIGSLILALLINLLLSSKWGFIPTCFSSKDWLGFWATYATGIFAVIIGYYAIVASNRNSRQAIVQQSEILIRQKSDEIFHEIYTEVKHQVRLTNLVRFTSTLSAINEDCIPQLKQDVLEKSSSISERHLQWALIKSLYLNSEYVLPIVEDYNKVWTAVSQKMSECLNMEAKLFDYLEEIKSVDQHISILSKLLDVLKSMTINESRALEISEYEKQKEDVITKKGRLIRQYEELVPRLNQSLSSMQNIQDELLTASVKFLGQLSGFTFIPSSDSRTIRH